MSAEQKTNVMRLLDQAKISYNHYNYVNANTTVGTEIAEILGQDPNRVFKTLVTVAPSKNNYVFVIPVGESLDLKKAAKTVSEKSVAMIKQKELLPLTGYIHGGCSPVGMKKQFKTFIHESARDIDTFCISAGHVGNQIQVSVNDIAELIGAGFADLIC